MSRSGGTRTGDGSGGMATPEQLAAIVFDISTWLMLGSDAMLLFPQAQSQSPVRG